MSNIILKNDFNILLNQFENNKSCKLINNILSWETINFDLEFKIINFIDNKLYLKIKNEFDCQVNFDDSYCYCNNKQIHNLITKLLNLDLETFLNKLNLSLKNINIENNNNKCLIWNPYEYLNNKKSYSFDINLLKKNAYNNNNFTNLDIQKEHIVETIIDEIKLLHDNNFELIFNDNDLFNFNVKLDDLNNLDEIIINIDLTSLYYPYYSPLLGFYNKFNDNLENKIINSSFFKPENWFKLKTKNLLIVMNYVKSIIQENVKEISDDSSKLNSIVCKICSLNNIKFWIKVLYYNLFNFRNLILW